MTATAQALGDTLRPASLNLERTRPMRVTGILDVPGGLEEIAVLGDGGSTCGSSVRAFRVRSGTEGLGLQPGDCLLAQTKHRHEVGDLVVVDLGGVLSAHRVTNVQDGRLQLDPALPMRAEDVEPRVIGTFAGILRKRLTAKRVDALGCPAPVQRSLDFRSSGTIRLLRGKLGMVESTCAATNNPRLRRALRNEAESLRRQLQNEATIN